MGITIGKGVVQVNLSGRGVLKWSQGYQTSHQDSGRNSPKAPFKKLILQRSVQKA